MAIYKGNKKVVAVYKGSTPINKIYKGSTLVFQKSGGGSTHLFEGTATGNFKIYINSSKNISITPDADGKWFYDTDEELTDLRQAFQYQGAVTSVDLSNLDLTDILASSMFYRCFNVTSIKFNNTKSMKLASIQNIFDGCSSLVSLNVSNFDTSNLTSANNLFRGCSSLVSLDLSNWNTSKFEYAPSVFEGCTSLETLDLSNFDMSSMKIDDYCKDMFKNCTSLSTIKCKQAFKDWCISKNALIGLTNYATINWEIVG